MVATVVEFVDEALVAEKEDLAQALAQLAAPLSSSLAYDTTLCRHTLIEESFSACTAQCHRLRRVAVRQNEHTKKREKNNQKNSEYEKTHFVY